MDHKIITGKQNRVSETSFYKFLLSYYHRKRFGKGCFFMKKEKSNTLRTLWKLFTSTFYLSAFTFGGGYVIITFMKKRFVDTLHWITDEEMLDMTAIAQSSPGAIAVNAAIIIGWKISGLAGMLVAVLGTILPPMIILSVVSLFYSVFITNPYVALVLKGMQYGVAAVILDVTCTMGQDVLRQKSILYTTILFLTFVAAFFFQINVILIILAAIGFGILRELFHHHTSHPSSGNGKEAASV